MLQAGCEELAAALGCEAVALRRGGKGEPLRPARRRAGESAAQRQRPGGGGLGGGALPARRPLHRHALGLRLVVPAAGRRGRQPRRRGAAVSARSTRTWPASSGSSRRRWCTRSRSPPIAPTWWRDLEAARVDSETERLRTALLSSVSHDLRSPLASVIGSATSLSAYGDAMAPADRQELLDSIRSEGERLDRYIQNLLDMTRLGSGPMKLQRDWVGIEEILASALGRLRKSFPDTPVETRPGARAAAALRPSGAASSRRSSTCSRTPPSSRRRATAVTVEGAARGREAGARRHRSRPRHPRGGAAADLRHVLQRGARRPRAARHRPGADHRARHGRRARRQGRGAPRPRRRGHQHPRHAAAQRAAAAGGGGARRHERAAGPAGAHPGGRRRAADPPAAGDQPALAGLRRRRRGDRPRGPGAAGDARRRPGGARPGPARHRGPRGAGGAARLVARAGHRAVGAGLGGREGEGPRRRRQRLRHQAVRHAGVHGPRARPAARARGGGRRRRPSSTTGGCGSISLAAWSRSRASRCGSRGGSSRCWRCWCATPAAW